MANGARENDRSVATVAILGDDPVVCYAIARLVEAGGYYTRVVDLGLDQETPAGVDIVLVTSGSGLGERLPRHPGGASVLELVDLPQDEPKEPAGQRRIPWPCPAKELQRNIRSAVEQRGVRGTGERLTSTP